MGLSMLTAEVRRVTSDRRPPTTRQARNTGLWTGAVGVALAVAAVVFFVARVGGTVAGSGFGSTLLLIVAGLFFWMSYRMFAYLAGSHGANDEGSR
jgi:energy-coupling factor transporter transmembrane protein EcfT